MADTGVFLEAVHETEAGVLPYRLFVPDGADDRPALVVMFHGCTQDGADFAAGTGMNERADEGGFLVLYPEQTVGRHPQKCWSWYEPAEHGPGGAEVGLVLSLVDRIVEEREVDPGRVYLAGISAGGSMVSLLAAARPERFAGIAVHSGLQFAAAEGLAAALAALQEGGPDPSAQAERAVAVMGDGARPIPTLVVHGGSDAVVRPVNAGQTARQWAAVWTLTTTGATGETGLRHDSTTVTDRGRPVHRETWTAPDGRVAVELHVVEGLGHAWSGGDPAGTYTDPEGPRATDLILDFFGLGSR